jgi:hypothetical protein
MDFIGYGNADARVVFVGVEEGLKRDVDLYAELSARSTYNQYMDLFECRDGGSDNRHFAGQLILQRTWGTMCRVMLARDKRDYTSLNAAKDYQAASLGRLRGETLLTELFPLPAPSTREKDWPYRATFPEFADRKDYEEMVLDRRIATLTKHFEEHSPDLVICYGKRRWREFKMLFPKAVWSSGEVFAESKIKTTRVILTPHFVARQMNHQMGALVALALH